MSLVFYFALALGALAVCWMLPRDRRIPGGFIGLIGCASLGGMLVAAIRMLPLEEGRPEAFYYIFTAISVLSAARVITHPRPVYAALYFVIVVLSTAGLMVLLSAEFMAFAMIIIYGGAILVTYMFVIMLATMPQSANEPETAAIYDRVSRRPVEAAAMGFLLLAALSAVIFDLPGAPHPANKPSEGAARAVLAQMPGKLRPNRLRTSLLKAQLIEQDERIYSADDVDVAAGVVRVRKAPGSRARELNIESHPGLRDVLDGYVTNIDSIGLGLFKGHALGIELAAIILLLAMVGAVVISKRRLPEVEGGAA